MKMIAKLGLAAATACGIAFAAAAPASAQVVAPYGPAYGYPSCYDAYGNYIYSYPYCTAYGYPGYVEPYVGIDPYWGWGGGYWGGGYWGGGHGYVGRGYAGGYGRGFAGGR